MIRCQQQYKIAIVDHKMSVEMWNCPSGPLKSVAYKIAIGPLDWEIVNDTTWCTVAIDHSVLWQWWVGVGSPSAIVGITRCR